MINKDNCILLGILSKPQGTRGSLHIRLSGLKAEEIKEKGLVFVEIDGLPVPFFVESFQEKTDDSAILKIEGIDTETRAREFSGYSVYVMKDQVKPKTLQLGLANVNGFRVIDKHLGFIGYAEEIINMPTNPLLVVKKENNKFLVPFHEDIVQDIDNKERLIRIEAPEGLFEL
jgi:16S rRNA processing protein RimM